MPIKYIGRKTDWKGKTLWEILGNLKNFGVGRMVIRNQHQRYPEPCYMRIVKVAAWPQEENEFRKVTVLVERVFRGKKVEQLCQLDKTTYKTDYILIPKDQEIEFTRRLEQIPTRIFPRFTDFPPLMKEMILRDMKASGTPPPKDLKLPLQYAPFGVKMYRVAEEGETPNVEISYGLGTPASPSLYANIKK